MPPALLGGGDLAATRQRPAATGAEGTNFMKLFASAIRREKRIRVEFHAAAFDHLCGAAGRRFPKLGV